MLGHLGKIAEVMVNDGDRPKDGNYLYGAFGRDFGTLDGKRLMVVGLTRNQWKSLVEATGLGEELDQLATRLRLDLRQGGRPLPGAARDRPHLRAVVRHPACWRRCAGVFEAHSVTWAPYRTVRETIEHDPDCSCAESDVRRCSSSPASAPT